MYTVVFSELRERDEEQEAKEKESALLLMMAGRQATTATAEDGCI